MKKNTVIRLSILSILALFIAIAYCLIIPSKKDRYYCATQAVFHQGQVKSSLEDINLIKAGGKVDKNLLEFLALFNIQHDGTIASINQALRSNFLRNPGTELPGLKKSKQDEILKEKALHLLQKMSLVDEIPHFTVNADYFFLCGAFKFRMEERLQDFIDQYQAGALQCKNLVLLAGVRYLRKTEIDALAKALQEHGSSLDEFLKKRGHNQQQDLTETDVWYWAWDQTAPKALKKKFQEGKNLFFVHDLKIGNEGTNRPTTKTTIAAWYEALAPTPGHCHANVEKPYAIRMEKILRTFLERKSKNTEKATQKFSITWNSPAADPQLNLAIYKDQLARTFYQELLLREAIEEAYVK